MLGIQKNLHQFFPNDYTLHSEETLDESLNEDSSQETSPEIEITIKNTKKIPIFKHHEVTTDLNLSYSVILSTNGNQCSMSVLHPFVSYTIGF